MNESEFESDPKVIDKYVRLHRTGEPDAMQQASEFFYRQLNRYVMKLAHEHYPTFVQSQGEDLIQCAWIGILEAIDRYDPYTYAMTTHFKPYILKQMSLLIQDVPSGHLADNLSRIRKVEALEGANPSELSKKSGLTRTQVENGLSKIRMQNTVDLDEIGGILVDECPDNQPEQALLQTEWKNQLNAELRRRLNRPEYEYICDRFGLYDSDTVPRASSENSRERPVVFAKLRDSTVLHRMAQGLG